jgi:lysophospholipase L1-like esterase
MWHSVLFCLVSAAQGSTFQSRNDISQIARNVTGFTAYDVLNYTNTGLDKAPKLEVPLRILCVGDSITEGWGSDANGGDGNGYRLSLAEHLSRKSSSRELSI